MADEAGELARAEAAVGLAREPAALFDRRVGVFSALRLLLVGCCAAGAVSGRINRGLARAELRGCRRVWARAPCCVRVRRARAPHPSLGTSPGKNLLGECTQCGLPRAKQAVHAAAQLLPSDLRPGQGLQAWRQASAPLSKCSKSSPDTSAQISIFSGLTAACRATDQASAQLHRIASTACG